MSTNYNTKPEEKLQWDDNKDVARRRLDELLTKVRRRSLNVVYSELAQTYNDGLNADGKPRDLAPSYDSLVALIQAEAAKLTASNV